MDSFIEIIALLGFALVSILANERARAKRKQAQREMRPEPRPGDEPVEVSAEERPSARAMLQRLQAHAAAFGIEDAVQMPAPPPPPVILEEPPTEAPVEVVKRSAPVLRPQPKRQIASHAGAARRRPGALLATIRTHEGLRRALLMREILGPPRAFEEHGRI